MNLMLLEYSIPYKINMSINNIIIRRNKILYVQVNNNQKFHQERNKINISYFFKMQSQQQNAMNYNIKNQAKFYQPSIKSFKTLSFHFS